MTTKRLCLDCISDISHRGYQSTRCVGCQEEYKKRYHEERRAKNKEKDLEYFRIHYKKNRDRILSRKKRFWEENRAVLREKKRIHYSRNREQCVCKSKEYRERNRSDVLIRDRERYPRRVAKENERRRKLGLPLVGEGYKYETEFKRHLDVLLSNHPHFDNKFWKCENGVLVNKGHQCGGLQLDRYYPDRLVEKDGRTYCGLAFEYDGMQHYKYNDFFYDSYDEFLYRQENDRQTDRMCEMANILLLRFLYKRRFATGDVKNFVSNINIL